MKKIVWTVGIILMIMAAVTVASASTSKGDAQQTGAYSGTTIAGAGIGAKPPEDANKGKADSKAVKSFAGKSFESASGGTEPAVYWSLPQFAWGRYGPISLSCCTSTYYRIYYGGYFSRYPAVTDTLNVRYPWDSYAVYSLGDDAGYTYLSSFDARLRTWYGDLTNAYIDWQAIG